MANTVKGQIKTTIGKTLNKYNEKVKPKIIDLDFKQKYQDEIVNAMITSATAAYVTTPETSNEETELELSMEGLITIPTIKGKTIMVDAEGKQTSQPGEGCKLKSVAQDENNILLIKAKCGEEENELKIFLKEPLRGLPNGVCDQLVKLNDGWYIERKCGKYTFTGDENWSLKVNSDNTKRWEKGISNFINDSKILCDKIKIIPLTHENGNQISMAVWRNVIILYNNNYTNTDDFKQWLKNNPITITYQLDTPIYEKLNIEPTLQAYSDTTMYLCNSLRPTVAYKYKAGTYYQQSIKQQSLEATANDYDIDMNIIPTLMDMDYTLMDIEMNNMNMNDDDLLPEGDDM